MADALAGGDTPVGRSPSAVLPQPALVQQDCQRRHKAFLWQEAQGAVSSCSLLSLNSANNPHAYCERFCNARARAPVTAKQGGFACDLYELKRISGI